MHLVSLTQQEAVHKSDSATFTTIMMPYSDPKVGEFKLKCPEAIGLAADF
jgi:hypothetical protein